MGTIEVYELLDVLKIGTWETTYETLTSKIPLPQISPSLLCLLNSIIPLLKRINQKQFYYRMGLKIQVPLFFISLLIQKNFPECQCELCFLHYYCTGRIDLSGNLLLKFFVLKSAMKVLCIWFWMKIQTNLSLRIGVSVKNESAKEVMRFLLN